MQNMKISNELIDFIDRSPSMFHSVQTISDELEAAGFTYLPESSAWSLKKGGKYYTTRNGSSVIAFAVGQELSDYHFQMSAAHTDSPTFKVKSEAELDGPYEYLRLNVEGYGGMIDSTWLDRPLSLAGRVMVQEDNQISSRLLYIDKDILLIPNVAIHLNRGINKGYEFNHQVDLLPLFSAGKLKKGDFKAMIASELEVEPEQIIAQDLFLVNREKGRVWGYADEFVSSPKLDDLQCAYATLKGFIAAENPKAVNIYACFDNEEVGSNTKQGALSTFLSDILHRINAGLGFTESDYFEAIAKSFLVSADNAHAAHPNHAELTDDTNYTTLNGGVVIKEAANQKYTSDAFSQAVFKTLCDRADVPVQHFANRSNMPGGSTLGNLSNVQVSVHALDIGLPQLAMHSSFETAGVADTAYAILAMKEYFNTNIQISDASNFVLD